MNPKYIAVLSGGAILPINSELFGLDSISPTEKIRMPMTQNHAQLKEPIKNNAAVASIVPTSIEVGARIFALSAANKKHVIIINPALRFKRPSGLILVLEFIPNRKFHAEFEVPAGPKRSCTMVLVSTQSSI